MRERIVAALAGATDVVFSRFHGDHVPLAEANPYQLTIAQLLAIAKPSGMSCRISPNITR